jgi:hypothetical protein
MVVWYIHRSEILHGARKITLLGVKQVTVRSPSPKTEFGLQNHYDRVIYQSIGKFIWSMKKYNFEWIFLNKPSEPINGIEGPNISMFVWYIHRSGIWYGARKNIFLGVKKGTVRSPKNGISTPNSLWSCGISIDREFYIEQEKIYTWGSKRWHKPSEPKNGIWAPKSLWSCGISIDQEFNMEQEQVYFWGSNRRQ